MSAKQYVIMSASESKANEGAGYWSNSQGWTALEDADYFTKEEKAGFPLPKSIDDDATWTEVLEVKAAPRKRATTLVFLRQDDRAGSMVGLLHVGTTLETDQEVKAALKAATTHWVITTEHGRSLWRYSCEDLNIGDLASSRAFQDATFLAALRERGVEYRSCFVGVCSDALSYDEVLVEENFLEEENEQ